MADLTIEGFLSSLPEKIRQANRNIFTYNENISEYWERRLSDYLNVLNVLYQRFSSTNYDDRLVSDQDNNNIQHYLFVLLQEVQRVYMIFYENAIASRAHHIQARLCPYEPNDGDLIGCPRKDVSKEDIIHLFDIHRCWKVVAKELGISTKTLYRRRIEYGLETSEKNGPRNHYTHIDQGQLEELVRDILSILPDAGESYVIGACKSRGVNVQRQRIRDAIMTVDPISRALRRTVSIIRRKYNVKAPNSLW